MLANLKRKLVQENCLEGSGNVDSERLDRYHCKSGAWGQSFAASTGRHKLDQNSSLLRILQWPSTILWVKSKLTFVILLLPMSKILSCNISSLSQIISHVGFLSVLTHCILSCLKMFIQAVPYTRTVIFFFSPFAFCRPGSFLVLRSWLKISLLYKLLLTR